MAPQVTLNSPRWAHLVCHAYDTDKAGENAEVGPTSGEECCEDLRLDGHRYSQGVPWE